jgi:hypothetical protein
LVEGLLSERIDGSRADIETISGWISGFCFWDEKGKWIETLDMLE